MSNTSEATPYESDDGSSTYSTAEVAEVSAWLRDTDQDREIDQRAKETRSRQLAEDISRKHSILAPPVVSIKLHMKKADTLLTSVTNAGYRIVQQVPRVNADFLILQDRKGGRIAVEQMHGGGVRLHAAHSRTRVDEIMRRHTLERAVEHLAGTGLKVSRKELPNGEIQLLARGTTSRGKEELHAQIRKDGSTVLDVVEVNGPRCEEIAKGFTEAIGGQITATNRKDDYYCLPGELRRERVQAK